MKKSARFIFPMLLAATAALAASAAAAQQVLRIATEGAYSPFNMVDAQGKPQGFDVDIANALCAEMKVQCEIIVQDWDGIIPGLRAKRYDAIVASMSMTPERKRVVAFTKPYYSNVLAFVASKKSDLQATPEKLKGKTIGAQRATIAGQYLEDKFGKIVTVKLYDTQDNAYLDLANGRLDGLMSDKFPAYNWLVSKEGADFEFKGQDIDINDKIGIAVRQEDKALRERLDNALDAIVNNGTYKTINAKYFPFPIY